MKPTANRIISFFYDICVNSSLNRYLNCCLNPHAYLAKHPPGHASSTAAQRENEARTARILHRGVMQMRLRSHSRSHSHSHSL